MTNEYYDMIFRRKSFHLFRGVGNERLTPDELTAITDAYAALTPLCPEIGTAVRIVPSDQVNFKRDAEYCILIYSEKKDNYLMNAGYIGEQLDLWLVGHSIGTLWYGLGKPDEPTCGGKDFVIMLAVRKVSDGTKYRRDMYKAKRRPLAETWVGEDPGVADVARFAPSACNSQPWLTENADGVLTVSRVGRQGRVGIMSPSAASYFNRIDMGIYLCFLEICLAEKGIPFARRLMTDPGGSDPRTPVAAYTLGSAGE